MTDALLTAGPTSRRIWQSHCRELAQWAWDRLAIKRDRHGLYSPAGGASWTLSPLTMDDLAAHFAGEITIGCGTTSPDDQCLWVAWDLDNHGDDLPPDLNLKYAIVLMNRLAGLGFHPLVEDSDGRGGIHVWVLFREPIPAATAYRFSRHIAADYADHGVPAIECFPKNRSVKTTEKECGHSLRVPGKHHKREHWSRFWGDGEWLDADESVAILLSAGGDDPALICLPPEPEKPSEPVRTYDPGDTAEADVLSALFAIRNDDLEYDAWLRVGMALHSQSDSLLPEWERWSSTSQKHRDGECDRRWASFGGGEGGVTPRTIFHLANQAGWRAPLRRNGTRQEGVPAANVDETPVSPGVQRVSSTNSLNVKMKSLSVEPFPTGVLPSRLRAFVESVSRAVGCDESFAALPALAVVSTAIGNSRRVSTKPGNVQPLVLWPVVIGLSGSQKSEPFDLAITPLNRVEEQYDEIFRLEQAQHKIAMEHHKLDLKEWRKSREGSPPTEPEKPLRRRITIRDTTSEALIKIHSGNPRGILCCNEELSGWFGNFDRYGNKGAVSGEQSKFLEFYDGKRITSDRVMEGHQLIPRAFVNVTGTIQPGIMRKALTAESRANGLAARLWMAYPSPVPIRWRDESVSYRVRDEYAALVEGLLSVPMELDSSGKERPALLELSGDSRRMFAEYMNNTGSEGFTMFGDLRAAWAKFVGRCARLAGIIHCCRLADGEAVESCVIDVASMESAISLSEWGKRETLRVYSLMGESEFQDSLRLLAAWVADQGGAVTARDVVRHKRDVESADKAEELLRALEGAGFGEYVSHPSGPAGGRPTAKFILKSGSKDLSTKPHFPSV